MDKGKYEPILEMPEIVAVEPDGVRHRIVPSGILYGIKDA